MLDSKKVIISTINAKAENISTIRNYVFWLIRKAELETAEKSFETFRNEFAKEFPKVNPLTAPADKVRKVFGYKSIEELDRSSVYMKLQTEILNIQYALAAKDLAGCSVEEWEGFTTTDRLYITILAHTSFKGIALKKEDFEEGVLTELVKSVKDYYAGNETTRAFKYYGTVKKQLRQILNSFMAVETDMFYGIKYRNSNLSDYFMEQFLAQFTDNGARRNFSKNKEKQLIAGAYKFHTTITESRMVQVLNDCLGIMTDKDFGAEVLK